MNLTNLLVKGIGIVLAVFGLLFTIQHAGFNIEMLVGLVLLIIGVWIVLGREISI